ncbi:MAG: FtsX-like permease family protein, partial [bacterium]|nr:FtsX-like permease family protein [bacterium]
KYKGYSLINISGLAIGLACCILIFLYLQYEYSYDKYHENSNNIYQYKSGELWNGQEIYLNRSSPLIGKFITDEIPEIEAAATFTSLWQAKIFKGENSFIEEYIYFSSPEILDIFTIPFVKGDKRTALDNPCSIIISEKYAVKYFGDEDPIGQTLGFTEKTNSSKKIYPVTLTVTGVIKDTPGNSTYDFDRIISLSTFNQIYKYDYMSDTKTYPQIMVLLKNDTDPEDIDNKIQVFNKTYAHPENKDLPAILFPFTDIHSEYWIDHKKMALFASIAFIILLIACINYVNLSTARSMQRSREVAVKKIVGALRKQIKFQFLGETIIFSFISFFISLGIVEMLLPYYNNLLGTEITEAFIFTSTNLVVFFMFVLSLGFIAGIYPSFFLSAFNPLDVIKKSTHTGLGNSYLRKSLVAVQFIASIILITSSFIINDQLQYMKNFDRGFDTENILVIDVKDPSLQDRISAFSNDIIQYPAITHLSRTFGTPPYGGCPARVDIEGLPGDKKHDVRNFRMDNNFIDTYGAQVVEGKGLTKDVNASGSLMVNEAFVKEFGLTDPIGKKVTGSDISGRIVGVLKDFHLSSLKFEIRPVVFHIPTRQFSTLSLRLADTDIDETVQFLEEKWAEFSPDYPFEYTFIKDDLMTSYTSEIKLSRIIDYFAFLGIFVACLGLFGLASFSTEKRTKEIGIRKVFGASVKSLITLINKEFLSIVLLANIVAWPVAYYFLNTWLSNFAFKVGLNFMTFAFASVVLLLIVFLTVGVHTLKIARANPMDALRHD